VITSAERDVNVDGDTSDIEASCPA